MMTTKYVLIDYVRGDEWNDAIQAADDKDAIEHARTIWEKLSKYDQKRRAAFYLVKVKDWDEIHVSDQVLWEAGQ